MPLLLLLVAGIAPCESQTLAPMTGVTDLAAGSYHNCAIVAKGGVVCWGLNGSGQVGDGGVSNRTTPAAVIGLASRAISIAAGEAHSCTVLADGYVWCWGSNSYGQLGVGGSAPSTFPVAVSNVNGLRMTAVAAGGYHSCALSAGAVLCWGANWHGQLGDGSIVNRYYPRPVTGLASGVVAVVTGAMHSCALTAQGAVLCWGDASMNQIGDGASTDRLTPTPVSGLDSGVAAIAAGPYHTCALMTGGDVRCWGYNSYGKLGASGAPLVPVGVAPLAAWAIDVAAGGNHSCALGAGSDVRCWGSNAFGQLGGGSIGGSSTAPVGVTGLSGILDAVVTGSNHSCAHTTTGEVQCWGKNEFGALGDGTTQDRGHAGPVLTAPFPSRFVVVAPATAGAGTPFSVSVAAVDEAGNLVIGYAGTIRIASSDVAATLPASVVLANGSGSFMATLRGGGEQTLTATDAADATITGTSDAVAVSAISSFSPASGGVGTAVTITGTGLGGASRVSFNGTLAPCTVLSPTTVVTAVPLGATSGRIEVTLPSGRALSDASFTASTSKVTPKINSFTPASGVVGTEVTIVGTDLAGATQVTFGSANAAFQVLSASSLKAVVPAGAASGKIVVATAGGTGSSSVNFTVVVPPSIASFTPLVGPVGGSVVVTGAMFTGATAVRFNGTPATYTVTSATSLTVKVPYGATSGTISVTGPTGTATSAIAFTVTTVPYTLTVTRSGSGAVSAAVPELQCGSNCAATADSGSAVTLTANPDAGWVFTGWAGACSGTAVTCTVAMTGNLTASASFRQPTALAYTGPTNAAQGASIKLSATLATGASPLAGMTVKFALGGKTYSAKTSASGLASVSATAPKIAGTSTVTLTYAGTTTYAPRTTTAAIVVQ